jgi:peptidoglycan/xylan/chitin deacetylase (PgdA/CDA1 family)
MNRSIVTTSWDDGHILDMRLADLLCHYRLPATFYIAPNNRQIPAVHRLSKGDIRSLANQRQFEIGAHTLTHPLLSEIDDDTAKTEIAGSKTMLEDWTGMEIKSFCYPSGDYRPAHKKLVSDAGFSLARTVKRFSMSAGDDPFEVPTTVHAYRHWSDASPIFAAAGISRFWNQYLHWDRLAISLFDRVRERGGVFHLWGHSWEIEAHDDWGRLENVLRYISDGDPSVRYITNQKLI